MDITKAPPYPFPASPFPHRTDKFNLQTVSLVRKLRMFWRRKECLQNQTVILPPNLGTISSFCVAHWTEICFQFLVNLFFSIILQTVTDVRWSCDLCSQLLKRCLTIASKQMESHFLRDSLGHPRKICAWGQPVRPWTAAVFRRTRNWTTPCIIRNKDQKMELSWWQSRLHNGVGR